ncbi:hypothetical protein Ahy_A05g025666 [Arachis hypogaea]|uniref:Uncharacterized protein n=1 Tax=Arachis hypogaea TaxID=3818 RepID=A0A445D971_ARAHY|nr:hypothetical protein Ahy_A05g025666 [Arachis hypogaea]
MIQKRSCFIVDQRFLYEKYESKFEEGEEVLNPQQMEEDLFNHIVWAPRIYFGYLKIFLLFSIIEFGNKLLLLSTKKNPQRMPRIMVICLFQASTLFPRLIDIESIKRTSNTCSTFRRPWVISHDLNFLYINVTNICPSKKISLKCP